MRHTIPFLAAVSLLAACESRQTTIEPVTLAAPVDTVPTTYAEVTRGAWLGGERFAVVAPPHGIVAIVDFAEGELTRVGGADTAAIQDPYLVFADEDTLYVADWSRRRLTEWGPGGRLLDSIPAPAVSRGALPQAKDAAAQFYAEQHPSPGPDGSGNRDSAAVVRLDPRFTRADTIARLAPLDLAEVTGNAGTRFERRVFSGNDVWGVLRDGSVWVARVYQNRVDWIGADGRRVRGDALPDRVLEVTRADREVFARGFPPELRRDAEQLPYSPIKPPFEYGFTGGDERVWLEKSRAIGDSARRYHVVDRAGHLVNELHLPGRGRILAASPTHALVAERAKEGVLLMRVELPR